MWSQVYSVLMLVASLVIVMSKITKDKEPLNKMSWIQISAVAILCIVATGLAVGIIYGRAICKTIETSYNSTLDLLSLNNYCRIISK